jgi:hypothetical protein
MGRSRTAVWLKRLGPPAALGLMGLAAGLSWWVGDTLGSKTERWRLDELWIAAGWIFAAGALLALAAGHLLCGWGELVRRGTIARRFLRAERRNLRGRVGLSGLVCWVLAVLAGLAGSGLLAGTPAWSRPAHLWELSEFLGAGGLILFFGLSVAIPMVLGASAAAGLAYSRRSGAAGDLLAAPLSADYLGWAAARAQWGRGGWMLLAHAPYCYAVAALTGQAAGRHVDVEPGTATLAFFATLLACEFLMFRRAAALGAWLGAALRSPTLAGTLAAGGTVLLWVLRLLAVLALGAIAGECFRDSVHPAIGWLQFWYLPLAALAWEAACDCLLVPAFLWLARGALCVPAGLRLGTWMIRAGGRLSGLGGQVAEEAAERFGPDAATGAAASPSWKLRMAGLWVLAVPLFLCFPITGAIASEVGRGGDAHLYAAWVFSVCLGLVLAGAGVVFVVGGFVIRRVRATL